MSKVKEIIILTASYYSKALSEPVLEMYAEDLEDLDPALVVNAYRSYRRDPKNKSFPLPAQIRDMIQPVETPEMRAREIAARIEGAIVKFGYPNGLAAKEYIGPEGWTIVERYGGWAHLCQNHGLSINPASFHAQVREQITTQVKHFEAEGLAIAAGFGSIAKALPWEEK